MVFSGSEEQAEPSPPPSREILGNEIVRDTLAQPDDGEEGRSTSGEKPQASPRDGDTPDHGWIFFLRIFPLILGKNKDFWHKLQENLPLGVRFRIFSFYFSAWNKDFLQDLRDICLQELGFR